MPAKPNVVTIVVKAGFGEAIPSPKIPDNPAVYIKASCNKILIRKDDVFNLKCSDSRDCTVS